MNKINKVFIVSLPRTGTTSACLYFLEKGKRVAHTAFDQNVFEFAEVIADTPVFLDFPILDQRYPQSKFVYLQRPLDAWIVSIRRLLKSMRKRYLREPRSLDPEIIRCFRSVFPEFQAYSEFDDDYLSQCYHKHENYVMSHFEVQPANLLSVNIQSSSLESELDKFCLHDSEKSIRVRFPHVNRNRKISYWQDVNHPNKIEPSSVNN